MSIKIDEDILKEFEKLKDNTSSWNKHIFTSQEDELLKLYWDKKIKREVADKLGIGIDTCRKRVKMLRENGEM